MGLLLWVDLETTGLDPSRDLILEVAAVLSDYDLSVIDKCTAVIRRPSHVLEKMDEWCINTHKKSGLWDEVLASTMDLVGAEAQIMNMLRTHPSDEKPVLAGSTISFDRSFMRSYMPDLLGMLHYRNLDVTSMVLLARAWYPDVELPPKREVHRAMPDIIESIDALAFLRKSIFREAP